jgi:acyl-coenzyme A synthetase/AMP-(fatty) acid ligase
MPHLPFRKHVVTVGAGIIPMETIAVVDLMQGQEHLGRSARTADDPALLMFTSGTTAAPKGVLHGSNTLIAEVRSIVDLAGLVASDSVFGGMPVSHIPGLLYSIFKPVRLQGSGVLQDIWDASDALELLARIAALSWPAQLRSSSD